uniref:Heat shock protein beta-3 n=1 Tax=Petromyzon marinus TaxID=7757 RepID=A0AAJ7U886_PETMA|nr:heat shock protein beta-3 [Petromyzon marinus]
MALACLRFWIETPVRYGDLLEASGLLDEPERFRLRHDLFALPGPRVATGAVALDGDRRAVDASRPPGEPEPSESGPRKAESQKSGLHESGSPNSGSPRGRESAAKESRSRQRTSREPGPRELEIHDCESQKFDAGSRGPEPRGLGSRTPSSGTSGPPRPNSPESESHESGPRSPAAAPHPPGPPRFRLLLDLLQFRPEDVLLQVCEGWLLLRAEHAPRFDAQGLCARRVTRAHALPAGVSARHLRALLCHDGVLVVETTEEA